MEQRSPTRWRRRKEARPDEILAAALESFAERGFAATRLEDVAARAGISKGTLYLYFKGKEELFKAVVRATLVPNLARVEALAATFEGPSAQLLERLLLTIAGVVGSRVGAIPKLVIAEAGNFPDLARFYLDEVVRRGLRLIGAILRRGIERGEFRAVDVDHAVFCVIAPMLIAALWKNSFEAHADAPLDAQALARAHLDLLLRGLEARRAMSWLARRHRLARRRAGRAGRGHGPGRRRRRPEVQGYVEGEYVYVGRAGRRPARDAARGARRPGRRRRAAVPAGLAPASSRRGTTRRRAWRAPRPTSPISGKASARRRSSSIEAQLAQAKAMLELSEAELERREQLVDDPRRRAARPWTRRAPRTTATRRASPSCRPSWRRRSSARARTRSRPPRRR